MPGGDKIERITHFQREKSVFLAGIMRRIKNGDLFPQISGFKGDIFCPLADKIGPLYDDLYQCLMTSITADYKKLFINIKAVALGPGPARFMGRRFA
jgi:hypothetical protein